MIITLPSLLLVVAHFVVFVSAFLNVPERMIPIQQHRRETINQQVSISDKTIITGDNDLIRRSRTYELKAGLFGNHDPVKSPNSTHISPTSDWQIYVDQSKASLDRGGVATFDAFFSLCDQYGGGGQNNNTDAIEVQVIPAILPKPVGGGKAPWIRCIWNTNKKDIVRPSPNLDVSNVDSVDKVYRVLTKHLGVENISQEACECLRWKYKGNAFLESGEINPAINAYNEALSICEEYNLDDQKSDKSAIMLQQQEGIILLLRASAFLKQAQSHKEILQAEFVDDEETKSRSSQVLQALFSDTLAPPALSTLSDPRLQSNKEETSSGLSVASNDVDDDQKKRTNSMVTEGEKDAAKTRTEKDDEPLPPSVDVHNSRDEYVDTDPQTASRLAMLRKLQRDGIFEEAQLRKLQYRHGLYQISLLQAARDALRATEVLPDYSKAWLRAGELLSDLWKIKESRQYYEKALSIDGFLEESIEPILQELEARQELLDRAFASEEFPEDTLQLALDIAG